MQSVPFDLLRCCTLEIFEVPAEARKYVPFSKSLILILAHLHIQLIN